MPRRSRRNEAQAEEAEVPQRGEGRTVPANVRERQRAVAEREASRLARPEKRTVKSLGHADRKKSAVSSTPSGFVHKHDTDESQEWCGPFSVARQMIAAREEARRKREEEQDEPGAAHPLDDMMEEYDLHRKRKAHPSLLWKGKIPSPSTTAGTSQSIYAKRQKRADLLSQGTGVPTLFQLAVNFLVENFEHVESLGGIDSSIRTAITKELVADKKMDGQSFQAIAEVGIETLEICDCAEVTQDEMSQKLRELLPAGLQYLLLDQSGRCFGPKTVEAIIETEATSSLFALFVGGAYLLSDADSARLIASVAKTVSSLEFKACPNLGLGFCSSISDSFSSKGKLLELALEDITLKDESITALLAKPGALENLKSISLRRVTGITDDTVVKLLEYAGNNLEGLDLSNTYALTDVALSGIRRFNPGLRSLRLTGLKNLTAAGLEALFTRNLPEMPPPPMLRALDLGCCDFEAVTDDVMELATQAATRKRDGVVDRLALLGGIVQLDIQGSHLVTDATMEYLASTCSSSLEELNVSFCPNVTDKGLGYLVDKCSIQLSKITIWGCAQLTDEFLDGHRRVDDPTLEINGVWMKKNSVATIR
jgi:hypothetical protein